ncbi:MAG: hypothetical protein L6Q53_14545 [Candidatus Brocadia sinica]|nr:hypothetical protein [Candidatus Brocadia sinica]
MSEKKKKEGSFDPRCIADIYDKLDSHSYALRALGNLIKTSDFNELSDDSAGDLPLSHPDHPSNLRWGISQIIDLYLAHQERILKEYVDQYFKSDMYLVGHAKFIIDAVDRGAYTSRDVAIRELREEVANLDTVINRNGELKEKAKELKETCMRCLKQLKGKEMGSA